jgi:ABC-type transport system involved in multi-copper enzyme maturation permease subunit
LPLHSFRSLLAKEWRELIAARSFWLLLMMIGPLAGHGFIVAVGHYAEASGLNGNPAALPEALTPLDGILVPTLGAYDLAATLLLPFVAIRLIAGEKENGGLKLLLQLPGTLGTKVTAKVLVLFGGWLIALAPAFLAMILWQGYGGHLHAAETVNLLLGHFLRMSISASVAVAAAAIAESAASAAIVTLGFTVGTWVLDFVATGRGGLLQQLAMYTPTAALRTFEQGLLRLSTVVVIVSISIAGFSLAVIWLHTGRTLLQRALATVAVGLALTVLVIIGGSLRASWDTSENRRNSFSRADEVALRQIQTPLRMTVFLAAEDPRLTDLEQNVLKKLRRVLPRLEVNYAANTRSGLFETSEDHYGEIWYEMSGQKVMDRSTIEQVVLEQIYKLSGQPQPAATTENTFTGYPLPARPRWAAGIFYGLWPLLTILVWWVMRR